MQATDVCHFSTPSPLALGDVENHDQVVDGILAISVGTHINPHFITASVTVGVESLSLVFLAFLDGSNNSHVIGVSIYTECVIHSK